MEIIQKNKNIKEIIAALKNGAVLVLPTDTVYGLVCDATNKKATEKIFKIKKRSRIKALPVFVQDIKMAKKYAVILKIQEGIIKERWPGAFTFVLKAKKGLSPLVYKKDTIAMRQPDYKLIMEIIKLLKKPLAQTSANISGQPSLNKISDIVKTFEKSKIKPDIIINGGNLSRRQSRRGSSMKSGQKNKPSVIIDLIPMGEPSRTRDRIGAKNKIKILRK